VDAQNRIRYNDRGTGTATGVKQRHSLNVGNQVKGSSQKNGPVSPAVFWVAQQLA
jgi:hypothetical protein